MPALTTIQLFDTHAQYLDADSLSTNKEVAFRHALNEVMPRIYKMGYWREMLMEHSQDASKGYVSLPQETDSIVAALIDKNPVPTRSLWHDYKMFGTTDDDKTQINAFVDDGYAPTYRDLVVGSQYKIQVTTLKAPFNLGSGTGVVTARYRRHSDATAGVTALTGTDTVLKSDSYTEFPVDLVGDGATLPLGGGHTDITEIISVRWTNVEADHPLRVQGIYQGDAGGSISADSTKDLILSDINTSNGVARYRRFRVGNVDSDSVAHMLLKRRWVDCDSNSDLVHIPSNSILKHALLGKLAEDNADLQRAQYHWGTVNQLLETDTDSYRGAAKPTLHIAPNGIGGGMSGMY